MAPQVRLELTTLRLTAECSAIELLRIILLCLLPSSLPRPPSLVPAALPLLLSLPCAPRLRRSRSLRARALPLPPHGAGAGKTSVSPAPLPGSRQRPTLPSRFQLSTISVWRLNFCVRYGYRWFPPAIVTGNFPSGRSPSLLVRFASLSSLSLRVLSTWLAPPPRTFKTAQVPGRAPLASASLLSGSAFASPSLRFALARFFTSRLATQDTSLSLIRSPHCLSALPGFQIKPSAD